LPIDASPRSERAIEHALDAAGRYGAELHVLYVVDTDAYSSYPGDEYVHEFEGSESVAERVTRMAHRPVTAVKTPVGE